MCDSDFMRSAPRPAVVGSGSRDTFSDSASMVSSRPSHRGGKRNENWYLDYYDPSFIDNPWVGLEREKGLEALGNWPQDQGGRG